MRAPDPREEAPIRVLIVDDSVVARAVLSRLLGEHEDVQVVACAGSAPAALRILEDTRVDIILLDLEMPGVDGLTALPGLIAQSHGARVLIVSSACADGASASLSALRAGAADTLLKPNAAAFTTGFAKDLVDKLRRIARPASMPPARLPVQRACVLDSGRSARVECVAIGSSTGGVHALATFFAGLPRTFNAPILVTQHLPAPFTEIFASQLTEIAGRRTRVAAPGLQPIPGELLLAPGDAHLTLVRTGTVIHVRLERKRSASGCLPSVDPMFASIAALYGPAAVGVVLSGMGKDGAVGAAALVEHGGTILAQDQESSVVWGMPGAVTNAGLARLVAHPGELARRLAEWNAGTGQWT
ncbi:chemotaxis-specific protein-glutamate methyltransferase CheB [uncultured Sphingomonas sp.]|uniref:chemotaxis-specific protein-glutamate methyltransferase CheB n=1 Tax=uncultured Sphingomonas sp. TaxID=158754 RepID=UPI0025FC96FF|nr:chemotaxis-specific protein-glutamate methyltransferase CheB [uncultured Sphingomonas sp.]